MTELARIASALERIADALEKPTEPAKEERVSRVPMRTSRQISQLVRGKLKRAGAVDK